MLTRRTAKIHTENAVSELKPITLGGIKQWILLRGESRSLPVLLFLHGGPGTGQIGFVGGYQQELEKHFVVANWDQRGAGLSYSNNIPKESMNVEQFVNDTIELTNWLRKEFNQEKIYLVGHSWGTILGMLAIHRHPEYYHHYFGVAQVTSMSEVEEISYQLLLEKAHELNDQKAINRLTEIGKPPWSNAKHDRVHQKYLDAFGGGISHDGKLVNTFIKKILMSKEYTLFDLVRFVKGQFFSISNMIAEMRNLDLSEAVKEVKVPITLVMGRYDLMVPSDPTLKWFNAVKAEEKTWVWFENSAHSPLFEENEAFVRLILEKM